jgi:uncharacterized caspase-like protein
MFYSKFLVAFIFSGCFSSCFLVYADDFNPVAPRVFAVIVGISDYEGQHSDLRYSSVDAELFYNNLKKAMPTECSRGDVRLILNSKGTETAIENTVAEVFAKAGPSDYIIFFFSGHGSNKGYFCPYNIQSGKVEHAYIKSKFVNSKAKYKVCFADACFSGDLVNQSSSSINQLEDDQIAMLMSSKSYQVSTETSSVEQGYFTYYIIKGMKGEADSSGDKYVTLAELFLYVKEKVAQATSGKQVPVILGSNLNRIPIAKIK